MSVSNRDDVKRKIEALEQELSELKKQKESTIAEKVVESTRFFIKDDGVKRLFEILQKELGNAEIKVSNDLWLVKCDSFGIQGQYNGIVTFIDEPKHPFLIWYETITGEEDVKNTLDDYTRNPDTYPFVRLISMLLDHSPKDDLFFYMPMYSALFWGMIKAAVFAHIQYQHEYGQSEGVRIENIKKFIF